MKTLILLAIAGYLVSTARSYMLYDLCKKDVLQFNGSRVDSFFKIQKTITTDRLGTYSAIANWSSVGEVDLKEKKEVKLVLKNYNIFWSNFYNLLPHVLKTSWLESGRESFVNYRNNILTVKQKYNSSEMESIYNAALLKMSKPIELIDMLIPISKNQLNEKLMSRNNLVDFFSEYLIATQAKGFPLGASNIDGYYREKIVKLNQFKLIKKKKAFIVVDILIPATRRAKNTSTPCFKSTNLAPFFQKKKTRAF